MNKITEYEKKYEDYTNSRRELWDRFEKIINDTTGGELNNFFAGRKFIYLIYWDKTFEYQMNVPRGIFSKGTDFEQNLKIIAAYNAGEIKVERR